MRKRIDRPIGEKFQEKNETFIVVESNNDHCFYCDFKDRSFACSGILCVGQCRKDGKEAIIKKVTEENV